MESREERVLSSTSGGDSGRSSTKKEAVKLPYFKGDEKCNPFLYFPVWRKQWQVLIEEYHHKWRSALLWDHIDDAARNRYVGWETDNEQAMNMNDWI